MTVLNNVKQLKNVILLEEGGFHNVFDEANQMAHCKKKSQNMHPQLINKTLFKIRKTQD